MDSTSTLTMENKGVVAAHAQARNGILHAQRSDILRWPLRDIFVAVFGGKEYYIRVSDCNEEVAEEIKLRITRPAGLKSVDLFCVGDLWENRLVNTTTTDQKETAARYQRTAWKVLREETDPQIYLLSRDGARARFGHMAGQAVCFHEESFEPAEGLQKVEVIAYFPWGSLSRHRSESKRLDPMVSLAPNSEVVWSRKTRDPGAGDWTRGRPSHRIEPSLLDAPLPRTGANPTVQQLHELQKAFRSRLPSRVKIGHRRWRACAFRSDYDVCPPEVDQMWLQQGQYCRSSSEEERREVEHFDEKHDEYVPKIPVNHYHNLREGLGDRLDGKLITVRALPLQKSLSRHLLVPLGWLERCDTRLKYVLLHHLVDNEYWILPCWYDCFRCDREEDGIIPPDERMHPEYYLFEPGRMPRIHAGPVQLSRSGKEMDLLDSVKWDDAKDGFLLGFA